jgi:peptide/nickel transport system substrate-binding protein
MWQDGQPFCSDDVKFNCEQVLLKYHARTKSGLLGVRDGIDSPDPNTVVFRFKQPYGRLLQRLDVVEAPIVAKHVYDGLDPTTSTTDWTPPPRMPIRSLSGRALTNSLSTSEAITCVWSATTPTSSPGCHIFDEVDFRIIPQPSTAVAALEAGEVDYVQGVPGPDLARVQTNPDITLGQTGAGSGGSFCADTMLFNTTRPPLDKPEVRQAFAYGMDRGQILHEV